MIRLRAAASASALAALTTTLAACGDTTFEATPTETSPPATTVAQPSRPATEVLPLLSTELSRLGSVIVHNQGTGAAIERIDRLWAETSDEVRATKPDLVAGFDAAIALARTAVERRRPADADKAFKNVSSLVDAYLGDG